MDELQRFLVRPALPRKDDRLGRGAVGEAGNRGFSRGS